MYAWIFESPLPLTIALATVGLALLVRGRTQQSRPLAIAGGVSILLAIAVFFAGRMVTSPGEHAARTTEALVDRAVAGDVEGAIALFTDDAVLNYGTREAPSVSIRDIRAALESLRGRNRIESNRITDLDFVTLDERTGEVELSCSTAIARGDAAVPTRWILRVRQVGDAWRIDRLTFRALFGRAPSPGIWR
ncbi:MAG: hypothetical protein RIR10_1307 [Planctomycetota bacterium]